MITSFEEALGELFITARGLGGPARGRVINDSRKVLPGDIFVAIPGAHFDAMQNARADNLNKCRLRSAKINFRRSL